jgi:hypothetical protein
VLGVVVNDHPNSYKVLLDAVTRKHPARVALVMFFAGFGLADFSLLCRAYLISNHDPLALFLYIKILVGLVLAVSTLYSAFRGENGNNT